jgi:tetratricopeptide (TPR) repeat protein
MIDNTGPSQATQARIEALNGQARALIEKDPRTSLELCKQAQALAASISDRGGFARSLWITGKCLHHMTAYDLALERLARSSVILEEMRDFNNLVLCLNDLARTYVALRHPTQAIEKLSKAASVNASLGRRADEAANLKNISELYATQGDHAASLEYQLEYLAIERELGRIGAQAESLQHVGASYLELGRNGEAIEYLEKALEAQRSISDQQGQVLTQLYLARGLLETGDHKRALDAARDGLLLSREIGYRQAEVSAHKLAGEVFARTGNPSKALRVFELAFNTAREIGDKPGEGEALIGLGRTQLALADAPPAPGSTTGDQRRQNLLREANQTLTRALEVANELGSRSLEYAARESLAQVLEEQGQASSALEQIKALRQLERTTRDQSLENRLIGLSQRNARPRVEAPAPQVQAPQVQAPQVAPQPQQPAPNIEPLQRQASTEGQNSGHLNLPNSGMPIPLHQPPAQHANPMAHANPNFSPDDLEPDDNTSKPRLRPFERDRNLESNPFPGPKNPYLEGNVVSMIPVVRQTQTMTAPPVMFEPFDPNLLGDTPLELNTDSTWREFLDLMVSTVAGVLALAIGIVAGNLPTNALLALMVTVAILGPGYALVASIFPRRSDLNLTYRAILSLGMGGIVISAFNAITSVFPWSTATPDSSLPVAPSLLAGVGFMLIGVIGSAFAAWRRYRNPGT